MITYIVHIEIKDEFISKFVELTKKKFEGATQEEGNIRFEFLSDKEEKGKFIIFEIWKSKEAISYHKQTQHYIVWRDAVQNMMLKPRFKHFFKNVA